MQIVQAHQNHPPSKEFYRFCNSLRCPLCGSQLDGNIHITKADLYCASNNNEYKCEWWPSYHAPATETLKFWYYPYEYLITITLQNSLDFFTHIVRYEMDASPIHKNSTRVELFSYVGPRILAFRQRMEEQQFLKKLKTIKVFS